MGTQQILDVTQDARTGVHEVGARNGGLFVPESPLLHFFEKGDRRVEKLGRNGRESG